MALRLLLSIGVFRSVVSQSGLAVLERVALRGFALSAEEDLELKGGPMVEAPLNSSLSSSHDGWVYQIVLRQSPALCIDLYGEDETNGTPIQIWECNGHESQLWFFDSGSYTISWAGDSNKCLDAGDMQDGTNIYLWDCNDLDQQHFGFDDQTGALYLSSTSASDATKCLDLAGGTTDPGTLLQVWSCSGDWNQLFDILSGITIRTLQDYKMCLDLPGADTTNGNALWLWECNGAESQYWNFEDGTIRYAADLSKCVDAGDLSSGNQLKIWDCNGLSQQSWGYDVNMGSLFLPDSSSDATICMDIQSGSLASGAPVRTWDCNGCWNQGFQVFGPVSGLASHQPSMQSSASLGDCPPQITVLSHCDAGGDDGVALGWPKFESKAELEADVHWNAYISLIYGEVPASGYPICTYSFGFVYAPVFKNVGMSKTPEGGCPGGDPDAGWFYSTMVGHPYQASYASWIFNPNLFKALPTNTFVEVTHGSIPGGAEAVGSWFYYTPGSAVWFNTGNTAAFKDHPEAVDEFLGKDKCMDSGCNSLFEQTFKAANAAGYTSVQYYAHGDQSCGRVVPHKEGGTGRQGAVEIIDISADAAGSNACGVAKGSHLRAGWEAKHECDCDNAFSDAPTGSLVANCKGFGIRR